MLTIKRSKSLKTRLIISLCTFTLLLTLTFSGLIIMTGTLTQDSIFNIELKKISSRVYDQYLQGKLDVSSVPENFLVAIGIENLSTDLVQTLELDLRSDGIYETQEPKNYHFTITKLPETDQRLYVLYDVTELERPYTEESVQWSIVIIPSIITTIIGILVGLLLAEKIISPVTRLAERVRNQKPDVKETDLARGFEPDEVGELATTIEHYTNRLAEFVVREQEFTRNVSHELRSPLAVVKNGFELLREKLPEGGDREVAVLDRIERAVDEMEELIETFLMLAREEDISHHFTPCDINEHVENILVKYDHLLSNKNVTFSLIKEADLFLNVPEPVINVILGNLIRNAFHYTTEGVIEIRVTHSSFLITNQTSLEVDSKEYQESIARGIGHSITARLTERLGYQFAFTIDNQTATATINFK